MSAASSRWARQRRGQKHKRRRTRLNAARTDCKNQRERMDDAEDQARGLPRGRGVVEAACKTLVPQWLQRSGRSWRDGKPAMLTMRRLPQSHRWAAAGALLAAHCRVGVIEVRQHGHWRELPLAKKAA